jgi:hypothetical protein
VVSEPSLLPRSTLRRWGARSIPYLLTTLSWGYAATRCGVIHGAVLLILLSFLGGCGGADQTLTPPMVTDSAGVEIVVNQGPTWARGERWRLSRRPVVSLGDSENDERYQFAYVSSTYRFPDGRIAVVDNQAVEIKLYDPNGVYLHNLSRRGEGPGEVQQPGRIRGYRGDSILISDGPSRYLFFDTEGVFGRVFQAYKVLMVWPVEDQLPASPGWSLKGGLSDGSFLIQYTQVVRTTGPGMRRGLVTIVRLSQDGTEVDTLAIQPGGRFYPRRGRPYPLPEHFELRVTVASHGDELFIGNGEEFRVDVLDREGTLTRSIRVDGPNPPLTEHLKESYEEFEAQRAGSSPEVPSGMLESVLSQPYPEHLPAYHIILVDEPGNLWVGHWPEDEFSFYPDRYTVFDPSGTMLGTVEFPWGFNVRQIGADFVLGTWRDEYDVHHVQLYDLVKPSGSQ